jgi:hypothetical protein
MRGVAFSGGGSGSEPSTAVVRSGATSAAGVAGASVAVATNGSAEEGRATGVFRVKSPAMSAARLAIAIAA